MPMLPARAFSQGALHDAQCACCQDPSSAPGPGLASQPCHELFVRGDPGEGARVCDRDVAPWLLRIFGEAGLRAIFGHPSPAGARRLHAGGLNHAFMIAHAGRLAKFVRPRSTHFSEAREAERLRRDAPGLATDAHALFPLAAFLCREPAGEAAGLTPYEVVVFTYLEGCHSLGDLVRMFERSHPMGALRSTSTCALHRDGFACEHAAQLQSLVAQQAARLNQRFQAKHGRRHGDFKADNVLLDRHGVPRLADFLSPFCRSCDRDEYLGSTDSVHPVVNEIRGAFGHAWDVEARRAEALAQIPGLVVAAEEVHQNVQLMEGLKQLIADRQKQNIFGPQPSLLSNIGLTFPTLDMTPHLGAQLPPWPPLLDVPVLMESPVRALVSAGGGSGGSKSGSGRNSSSPKQPQVCMRYSRLHWGLNCAATPLQVGKDGSSRSRSCSTSSSGSARRSAGFPRYAFYVA